MDAGCLAHRLTDADRSHFDQHGYLIVENALAPERLESLARACDRLITEQREADSLGPHDPVDIADIIGRIRFFLISSTARRLSPRPGAYWAGTVASTIPACW